MQKTPITLATLIRLDQQMAADGHVPLRDLQARDRAIGASVEARPRQQQLLHWLNEVQSQTGKLSSPLAGIEVVISFWLTLLGIVLGAVVISGLLFVDTQQPVNVLWFLGVFVGLQLLTLVLTFVASVLVAGGHPLHLPLSYLNPARLLLHRTLRRSMPPLPGGVDLLRRGDVVDVLRLAVLRWGQLFAVFFNISALATFFLVLIATDRSFGWSSTINMSNTALLNFTEVLAVPWSHWFPSLTVDAEVIAATRYQNLQSVFDSQQLSAMRAWWPFLMACIVTYALLPRLILWLIFHFVYRHRLKRSLLYFPGVNLVLQRMATPLVHTQSTSSETPLDTRKTLEPQYQLPNDIVALIDWSGAIVERTQFLKNRGIDPSLLQAAGIDLAEDTQLLQAINDEEKGSIVIAVKGWEPPLADLGDFLDAINPAKTRYLLLLGLNNKAISENELRDWQLFIQQRSDTNTVLLVDGVRTNREGS